MGTVDRMEMTQDRWVECFRIVDTVLTKVIQVQRLHMNLICDFVAFSDTGNGKEMAQKQKKECERLEDEMKFLKKTMFEQVLCSETGGSNNEYSTSELDLSTELKQENDVELIDNDEEENRGRKLRSFTPSSEGKKKRAKLSCNSNEEQNTVSSIVFVDTNAVMSDGPVIKLENSQEDEIASADFLRPEDEEVNVEDVNPWLYNDTKDFPRTSEQSKESNNRAKPYETPVNERVNQLQVCDRRKGTENLPAALSKLPDFPSVNKHTPQTESPRTDKNTLRMVDKKDSSNLSEATISSERNPPLMCQQPAAILESSNPMRCVACGKSFTRKKCFVRHMYSHDNEALANFGGELMRYLVQRTREKSFECEVCARKFSQSSGLTKHMRVHNGEKPFECAVCAKKFSQTSSLTKHMRIHSGEMPYECKDCGKKFCESSNLIRHSRIHNGEKPYKCDVCDRQFRVSSNLIKHKQVHNCEKDEGKRRRGKKVEETKCEEDVDALDTLEAMV